MPAYDAFLLLSFGGPEGPDDVLPFLENVTRGRGVPAGAAGRGGRALPRLRRREPDQRPVQAAARSGRRRVRGRRHRPAALLGQQELAPVHRGHGAADERRRRAPARSRSSPPPTAPTPPAGSTWTTSTARSPPSAQAPPVSTRSGRTSTTPGFIEPFAASAEEALAGLPAGVQAGARLVFTAHSVPVGMAAASGSRVHRARPSPLPSAAGTRPSCGKPHGLSPNGCAVAPSRSTWSSRAAAARRACPGWNRT